MSGPTELPEDAGLARVRAGVLGAPAAPRLAVIEGGAGNAAAASGGGGQGAPKNAVQALAGEGEGGGDATSARTAENTCPLVPLGHADGEFHFLDNVGQKRQLKSRAITSRGDLVSLFLGDTSWLFEWFPNIVLVKERDAEGNVTGEREEVRGFSVSKAGEYLMRLCGAAGLFGSHVVLRGPGVWAGEDGAPVVHCGDIVLSGRDWKPTGFRSGNQVWISAAPRARPGAGADGQAQAPGAPGFAAGPGVAQGLQREIAELWEFRLAGSEIVCLGLMGVGYFGTAARWRPNGYLIGGTGSGKSMLLQLLRACVPHAEFSTDTSKAGIEGAINGKPSPVYLDEAGDRQGNGAQLLLDVVLSATGGDGTRGLRGSADGGSRAFSVACSVIMAAVAPPEMGPQHRDRFTIVHMVKPGAGADNRDAMETVIRRAAEAAPGLWGRALAGWPRFEAGLGAFREALARHGCAPREMDQAGAILAAWWVLTADGLPSQSAADDAVRAIAAFLRGAEEVAEDDGPRRVVRFLASSLVQRDRSTDIEQIGVLVAKAFRNHGEAREGPQRLLERFGIRVVQESDALGTNGKPIPRGDLGAGLWLSKSAEPLKDKFRGSPYEGERWVFELARLPGAVESRKSVRVGGVSGPAIWVPQGAWSPPGEEDADTSG
jgi:hypothetical protein